MDQDYANLAYERALIAHVSRYLKDKLLAVGSSEPAAVVNCDDLPYSAREVPQASVMSFLRRLSEEEKVLTQDMAQYQHTRHRPPPLSRVPQNDEQEQVKVPAVDVRKKTGRGRGTGT